PLPYTTLSRSLEAAYSTYAQGHPWVRDYELSPKTVVRDMYERAMNFVEYIGFYSLARSEGVLLRYLADVYDALRHSVPAEAKDEQLADLVEWLGAPVRTVDSSLLDEWEALREPGADASGPEARPRPPEQDPDRVTANERAFRVMVRNAMFRRVELAARQAYDI